MKKVSTGSTIYQKPYWRSLNGAMEFNCSQRRRQQRVYKSGEALVNHCLAAHDGKVAAGCLACDEIQQKSAEAA